MTVAHLVERKRHADVLRALWTLRERHPSLRYRIVGDGPERPRLEALAARARSSRTACEFTGQLEPGGGDRGRARRRRCS